MRYVVLYRIISLYCCIIYYIAEYPACPVSTQAHRVIQYPTVQGSALSIVLHIPTRRGGSYREGRLSAIPNIASYPPRRAPPAESIAISGLIDLAMRIVSGPSCATVLPFFAPLRDIRFNDFPFYEFYNISAPAGLSYLPFASISAPPVLMFYYSSAICATVFQFINLASLRLSASPFLPLAWISAIPVLTMVPLYATLSALQFYRFYHSPTSPLFEPVGFPIFRRPYHSATRTCLKC